MPALIDCWPDGEVLHYRDKYGVEVDAIVHGNLRRDGIGVIPIGALAA